MKCKNKTIVHGGLAALAAVAMLSGTTALAQNQSQYTPPAQTYQNNNTGPMQNSSANPAEQNSTTNPSGTQGVSTESLSNVQNAKTTLASAQVQDANGQQIGQVKDVHTGNSGKPTKVDITLMPSNGGNGKTVSVKATDLRYDQQNNTLVTNLTTTDLQAMPAASSSTSM